MSDSPGYTGPVRVGLANGDNVSHEFSVSVVEGEIKEDIVGIHRADGTIGYTAPGQGTVTYTFRKTNNTVSRIELPANRTRSVGTYDLAPDEQHQMNVTGLETGDTLVIVDRSNGIVGSLVTSNCAENGLEFVSVTAGPTRTQAGDSCY
ncbi:hypothetical protein RBH20_19930 [Haloarcula sp. H-GB4]|uniref:hypothetical protein n=1 Tax=Haloarcula sp. H-GB4 TaxID=3069755 RepID=UPI0027B01943|nr:hypothetical protein [Haloarcula sp. H-GB4]MDQ2074799.1 hypothetical protein [Haloarcula sp. H-GB4]